MDFVTAHGRALVLKNLLKAFPVLLGVGVGHWPWLVREVPVRSTGGFIPVWGFQKVF